MHHWLDPVDRGVLHHPAAPPPLPRHRAENSLSERLARLEEHTHFAAWDRRRIEEESRARGHDLKAMIDATNARISPMEDDRTLVRNLFRTGLSVSTSMINIVRWSAVAVVITLMLAGQAQMEVVRVLLRVLGG